MADVRYLSYFVHVVDDIETTCQKIIDLYGLDMTADDLFNYEDNKESIFSRYNDTKKRQFPNGSPNFVFQGTRLKIKKF